MEGHIPHKIMDDVILWRRIKQEEQAERPKSKVFFSQRKEQFRIKKCYSRKEETEKPILMEVTRSPQDLRTTPMLLAVTPFPKPLTTPPVTSTYFICLSAPAPRSITSRQRTPILPPREGRNQARGKRTLPLAAKERQRRIVARRFA